MSIIINNNTSTNMSFDNFVNILKNKSINVEYNGYIYFVCNLSHILVCKTQIHKQNLIMYLRTLFSDCLFCNFVGFENYGKEFFIIYKSPLNTELEKIKHTNIYIKNGYYYFKKIYTFTDTDFDKYCTEGDINIKTLTENEIVNLRKTYMENETKGNKIYLKMLFTKELYCQFVDVTKNLKNQMKMIFRIPISPYLFNNNNDPDKNVYNLAFIDLFLKKNFIFDMANINDNVKKIQNNDDKMIKNNDDEKKLIKPKKMTKTQINKNKK